MRRATLATIFATALLATGYGSSKQSSAPRDARHRRRHVVWRVVRLRHRRRGGVPTPTRSTSGRRKRR